MENKGCVRIGAIEIEACAVRGSMSEQRGVVDVGYTSKVASALIVIQLRYLRREDFTMNLNSK